MSDTERDLLDARDLFDNVSNLFNGRTMNIVATVIDMLAIEMIANIGPEHRESALNQHITNLKNGITALEEPQRKEGVEHESH